RWLDEVASDRGLTASDFVRQYIRVAKHELDEKKRILADQEDDFRWTDTHNLILGILADDSKQEPMPSDEIYRCLHERDNRGRVYYGGDADKTEIPRALNALTRNRYLRRLKSGYALTPKGKALADR